MNPALHPSRAARTPMPLPARPRVSLADFMALLNERLRAHPMFLEGMHFPDPQPGSTPMLAAAVAWEGPWDCLGVFSSVIDEVTADYELCPEAQTAFSERYRPAPSH
jgi:hypothetical protein